MRFTTLISKILLGKKILPGFIRYTSALLLLGMLVMLSFSLVTILTKDISHSNNQLILLNINFLLAAIVVTLFVRHCLYIFIYRRKDFSKIRLNSRLAAAFCVLAFIPGTIVLCFALVFINSGVETWFSTRVTRSLDHSLKVAQAYLQEHEERLLAESKTLSKDPIFSAPSFLIDVHALKDILEEEKDERDLAEISMYNSRGKLIAYAGDLMPNLSPSDITQSFDSMVIDNRGIIYKEDDNNRITAITKLPYNEGYLVLRRWVHPAVLFYLDSTQEAYQEYYQLRSERNQVKMLFSLLFGMFSIVLLCGSVFFSIRLARRIVHPLESLVEGTQQIAKGKLNTKINVIDNDEIGELTKAFNFMVSEINQQQKELQSRNKEIQTRGKTIEAVLAGVSSGVMTIDKTGLITLANKTAEDTFDLKIGDKISVCSKEISELVHNYIENNNPANLLQDQIKINIKETTKEFLIRIITLTANKNEIVNILITFDDITELHSAQKLGAWADVARRMAHEIKNPLTPIQLSAERLRRRFSKQITDSQDLFIDLTELIIRQVDDLRSLVNEFSDFARMPSPVFEIQPLFELVKEIVLLQENRKSININLDFPKKDVKIKCDPTQIKRALNNLVENAVNAIEENNKKSSGSIDIVAKISQNGNIELKIIDDGPGIPEDVDISKLFDPYITTRKKGTGLGLAIVKKIIDEHKGSVTIYRRKPRGTIVSIILPLN